MEEQRTILARKTYALDTAWWRGNSRVKLAKTTSYIQYRLIQQSHLNPRRSRKKQALCLIAKSELESERYEEAA